jgi:hypothetical protein
VIIVRFALMACRVLGITSVGDRANILKTDRNVGTRTDHLVGFLRNGSLPTRVEFVASLLMLQHEQPFGPGTENGHSGPREFFQSQLLLKNLLNRRHTVRKRCASARELAKGHF